MKKISRELAVLRQGKGHLNLPSQLNVETSQEPSTSATPKSPIPKSPVRRRRLSTMVRVDSISREDSSMQLDEDAYGSRTDETDDEF